MTTHNQNTLILRLRDTIRDIDEHQHPVLGADMYCLNLYGWMGERMPTVLRILNEAQAEIDERTARESALAADAEKLLAEKDDEIDRLIAALDAVLIDGSARAVLALRSAADLDVRIAATT